jgi:hypothetical protein
MEITDALRNWADNYYVWRETQISATEEPLTIDGANRHLRAEFVVHVALLNGQPAPPMDERVSGKLFGADVEAVITGWVFRAPDVGTTEAEVTFSLARSVP